MPELTRKAEIVEILTVTNKVTYLMTQGSRVRNSSSRRPSAFDYCHFSPASSSPTVCYASAGDFAYVSILSLGPWRRVASAAAGLLLAAWHGLLTLLRPAGDAQRALARAQVRTGQLWLVPFSALPIIVHWMAWVALPSSAPAVRRLLRFLLASLGSGASAGSVPRVSPPLLCFRASWAAGTDPRDPSS